MKEDSGCERRKFVRIDCPCRVIFHNPERVVDTRVRNISAGGVRVVLGEEVKEHDAVGLEVYLTPEGVKCEGRVVWVIAQKGEFDCGIEFYEIADKDRLFIDEFVKRLVTKGGCDGK